jgi:predicted PurR-regulated permease PerM
MSLQRQFAFWTALLIALGLVLFVLRESLLPFVAGFSIAYILQPFVSRLTASGWPRVLAVSAVMSVVVLVLVGVVLIGVPKLAHEMTDLIIKSPDYLKRIRMLYDESLLAQRFGRTIDVEELAGSVGGVLGSVGSWLSSISRSLLSGGMAVFGAISAVFLAPIIAFYLLLDWDRMVATVDGWIPHAQRNTVRDLFRRIDRALAGFIRGQSFVCLFLGTWYAIGLALVGLNFGLLIGIAAGLLSFIPFVGTIFGLIAGLVVAVAQFWPDWWPIAGVLVVFAAGQFLEGNVLSPKIVGEAVGLHPVWLMFSLFAFGSLFGFLGLLVAVPVAAAMGVLLRFGIEQYRRSVLFLGPEEGSGPGAGST